MEKNLMFESTPFGNPDPEIKVATPKLDEAISYYDYHPNSQFQLLAEALIEIREIINNPKL
jgi:hypothetical protein